MPLSRLCVLIAAGLMLPMAALASAGPPPGAFEDCRGKAAGDAVEHHTPGGSVAATCVATPEGLAARPDRPGGAVGAQRQPREAGGQRYSLEQAMSDGAQLHTIAFNGLAFITGSFGASSFIPPGKVADFFGFQYMRDIDAAGKGHNPQFLDRVAGNVLTALAPAQLAMVRREAEAEAPLLQELARQRLPLIAAFHRQLAGTPPAGSVGLNLEAVTRATGELFAADAALAYRRAELFGRLAASLDPGQRAALGRMRFGDFASWPAVALEPLKLPRGVPHLVDVAYLTLASEFFSWIAGSAEADTYFCPERHGTYFGGFFLKDAPAMGKHDFDISTALTGDLGEAFLKALDPRQRAVMTAIPQRQRRALGDIVTVRRAVAAELRRFLKGETADRAKVLALGRRYGELDGELAHLYATAFADIARSLTAAQRDTLQRLRNGDRFPAAPAYLYSDPLAQAPAVDTAPLFFPPR